MILKFKKSEVNKIIYKKTFDDYNIQKLDKLTNELHKYLIEMQHEHNLSQKEIVKIISRVNETTAFYL